MKISLHWANRYLDPGTVTADEAEHALTFAGLPIETREPAPGGDTILDVEVTSNRGDCLCHLGIARELAALTNRRLKPPVINDPKPSGRAADHLRLDNTTPDACPLFLARVIRGVKVGPSPAWLADSLAAIGQRPINNVVDVTNFLTFEYGQPAHVFDLHKLAGRALVIRWAKEGEPLRTLDGKQRKLRKDELVVADAEKATSLAGVIGGADSEVDPASTDIVLETATWDAGTVRRASRRHQVRTDASHRFERLVDPRTIDEAARRAVALIVELAGGTLCEGVLSAGRPPAPPTALTLRPDRCRAITGMDLSVEQMVRLLQALKFKIEPSGDSIRVTVPAFRPDVTREIDVIEEIARTRGLEHVPLADRLPITIHAPQPGERAMRELASTLTGLGFFEAVTFTFVTPVQAAPFMPPGLAPLGVDDERRRSDGTLRPSIIPSLLACRAANHDRHATVPGGIRLYEAASVFAEHGGKHIENRNLALCMDVPGVGRKRSLEDRQAGIRIARGAIEAIVRAIAGAEAALEFKPGPAPFPAGDPSACAGITLDGQPLGYLAMLAPSVQSQFGLEVPQVIAEVNLPALLERFPPPALVQPLPAFPHIDRDLSLIVRDDVPWDRVRTLVEEARLPRLESCEFIGTYRGKQYGEGRKSVTLRLRFRDPARTLRHEEVDPEVGAILDQARNRLGAEVRT